jgi:ethanolamine utilization protein EutN
MKLGTVIGRVTLSQTVPALAGARWLLVSPWTREHYGSAATRGAASPLSSLPSVVVYDALGGGVGDVISFVAGREAARPFEAPTPVDAISAALVDHVHYQPQS